MNNPYNTLLWTNSKRHFKSESNYYGIFKVRSLCSDKNDGYMNIFQDEIHADGIDSTSNTCKYDTMFSAEPLSSSCSAILVYFWEEI